MNQQILTIKYDIDKPVPLADFVASLDSLQKLHGDGHLQLCVKEIRKGSYIFELMNQIPDSLVAVMPTVMEQTENLTKFASNVAKLLNFFKSGEKEPDEKPPTRQEAVAAHDVVLPLTVDNHSKLEIHGVNGTVNIYNYTEANAIQNSARGRIRRTMRAREREIHSAERQRSGTRLCRVACTALFAYCYCSA